MERKRTPFSNRMKEKQAYDHHIKDIKRRLEDSLLMEEEDENNWARINKEIDFRRELLEREAKSASKQTHSKHYGKRNKRSKRHLRKRSTKKYHRRSAW